MVAHDHYPFGINQLTLEEVLTLSSSTNRDGSEGVAAIDTPAEHVEQCILLWREMLKRDDLDAESHFFNEGGKSLLAARLLVRANKLFGQRILLSTLFEAPTPRLFAERLQAAR